MHVETERGRQNYLHSEHTNFLNTREIRSPENTMTAAIFLKKELAFLGLFKYRAWEQGY